MTHTDSDEYGRPRSRIIERRAKKIRSIRDKQFEQTKSWYDFRQKLLKYLADGGPITDEVYQVADDFWRAGVKDYVRYMGTKKAENVFIAQQESNWLLEGR
jgi:hypothetical protein